MKELYEEHLKQKEIVDKLIAKLEKDNPSGERNKKLFYLRDMQFELAEKIRELKKYVLE